MLFTRKSALTYVQMESYDDCINQTDRIQEPEWGEDWSLNHWVLGTTTGARTHGLLGTTTVVSEHF